MATLKSCAALLGEATRKVRSRISNTKRSKSVNRVWQGVVRPARIRPRPGLRSALSTWLHCEPDACTLLTASKPEVAFVASVGLSERLMATGLLPVTRLLFVSSRTRVTWASGVRAGLVRVVRMLGLMLKARKLSGGVLPAVATENGAWLTTARPSKKP